MVVIIISEKNTIPSLETFEDGDLYFHDDKHLMSRRDTSRIKIDEIKHITSDCYAIIDELQFFLNGTIKEMSHMNRNAPYHWRLEF